MMQAKPKHRSDFPPPPLVQKPETVKSLGSVDPQAAIAVLRLLSEQVWAQEDARKENDFSCFHHTQHVVFRFIHNLKDPRHFYSNPVWHVFKSRLLPLMHSVVEPYGFANPVFPKAMFARLEARQGIDPHYDGAGANLLTHKIHIPLSSNDQVSFYVDGTAHHLAVGQAYEVNNIKRHGVDNSGDSERIHFIFEVFDYPEAGLFESQNFD